MRSETWKNARHVLLAAGWLMAACGGSSMTPGPDDGGMPGDGGFGHDGAPPMSDFDPSQTYEGEGTACRMSLQCGDRQLCVRGECMRHERIDRETAEFGLMRQAGVDDEDLADTDFVRGLEGGALSTLLVVPGRGQASLVALSAASDGGCEVIRIERRWQARIVPNLRCLSAEGDSNGHLFISGRVEDGPPLVVELDDELREVARWQLSLDVLGPLAATVGRDAQIGAATSVLVDGNELLIAVGVKLQPGRAVFDATIVVRMGPEGTTTPMGERPYEGGRGWLFRDDEGVRLVSTVWDWGVEDALTRRWPTLYGTHRIVSTHLGTESQAELYAGTAQNALFMRPSHLDWRLVVMDLAAPRCRVDVLGPHGSIGDGWVNSRVARRCHEHVAEPVGGSNGSMPSRPESFFIVWESTGIQMYQHWDEHPDPGDWSPGDPSPFLGLQRVSDGLVIAGDLMPREAGGGMLVGLYDVAFSGVVVTGGYRLVEAIAEARRD